MKFGGILIALAIVLSGCSGEPAPKEPIKTASPTPKSTATPPVMPDQAKEDSPEGAAAFVNYWVKVSNYAAATGDVAELDRISSPDCSGCQRYVALYMETYKAGGYFRGGAWEPGELTVRTTPGETFLTTDMMVMPGRSKKNSTAKVSKSSAETTTLTFVIEAQSDRIDQLFLGDAP